MGYFFSKMGHYSEERYPKMGYYSTTKKNIGHKRLRMRVRVNSYMYETRSFIPDTMYVPSFMYTNSYVCESRHVLRDAHMQVSI